MSNDQTLKILIPNKFLSLMLHLIVVTMNYFSYHDNILATYPNLLTTSDDIYVGARVSFLACNTLTVILLAFEILILFSGRTMFRNTTNVIISTLHYIGAIFYCSYGFQKWSFYMLWALWAPFSLLPFIMQLLVFISVGQK